MVRGHASIAVGRCRRALAMPRMASKKPAVVAEANELPAET